MLLITLVTLTLEIVAGWDWGYNILIGIYNIYSQNKIGRYALYGIEY